MPSARRKQCPQKRRRNGFSTSNTTSCLFLSPSPTFCRVRANAIYVYIYSLRSGQGDKGRREGATDQDECFASAWKKRTSKKTRDGKNDKKQEKNTKLAASIIPFSLIYIYRQTCTLYLFSILLLDPGGDMESPRDGNEQRGEDKLGVDGLWGEGVDKVALVDAEAAEHEGGDGGQGVEGGGHVLAQPEDVGRRVVARPLGVHAHGGRAARHAGGAARTCCGGGGHAGAAAHGAELCRAEGGRDGDA
jgi:hypothetical protein